MSYATVLLHLDAHPRANERIDFAARLARRFEAHLVGVAAADRSLFALGVATGFAGTRRLAEAVEESRGAASARARHFVDRAKATASLSFEAVLDEEDDLSALMRRSNCCDLLVVGQPDPAWPGHALARQQLELFVLHSTAPTLVIPHAGEFPDAGSQVLIAWNGSSEAARAVAAAMPLLQRARKVILVRCDTPVDVERPMTSAELDLPREWLGRHGVRVETWLEAAGTDAASALLSRAADFGADLLVMGAWGHARWTERVLGGVTRTILSSMTVPVLMAH
ncbi:MAG: universal stress protein [Betaproteobacteria bacterium]